MKKIIGVISGDPNSINSEIIAKTWKKRKRLKNLNIFIIGNFALIKKQFSKMGYEIKINKINNLDVQNFENKLNIYDVPLNFQNAFNVPYKNKKKYINDCFETALELIKKKKIFGLVNCAINKRDISSKGKTIGVTELLAKKNKVQGKEVMLIYNNSLSVCPITTHIRIKLVSKNLNKKKIINKTLTINNFFRKKLGFTPKIGVLGMNPHNDENKPGSEEKKIIFPAINFLKKKGLSIKGPISPDTAFLDYKKNKFDIIIGMYHDQVLSPFKAIFKFKAINITLGLPFLRVSPDHGIGEDIVKKNKANPESLIESINFFKKINA